MTNKAVIDSPLGHLSIVHTEKGLSELRFTDDDLIPAETDDQKEVEKCVSAYFDGDNRPFTIRIDWTGYSDFAVDVCRLLHLIPYGRVRTYGEIADYLGTPKAARAIGRIIGKNPIAIITPCHRVIGSKGELTGYAYGLKRKKWLLDHEQAGKYSNQVELFNLAFEEQRDRIAE